MKDKILASVGLDHTFECATNIIARAGEGGVVQLEITLAEELCDNVAYLDFEKPNGEKFRTSPISIVNGVVKYVVPIYLLAENGDLKVQLILEDKESEEAWKSSVKRFHNLESINAGVSTDEMPVIPLGTIEISRVGEIDVKHYATAQIVDANLKPENIAKGVNVLGIDGVHVDRIIDVSALPTKNIDEAVLYKYGDSYYKYVDGDWQKYFVPVN